MIRLFRTLIVICMLPGLLLLAVSFTPLVSYMARDSAVDWFEGDADVLVVLGGSMLVNGTGPQSAMGYDSYLRCIYASWIMQRFRYTYVVVSGPDGLAENMARFLASNSPRPQQFLIESAARSTAQNAEFVKTILDHKRGLSPHAKIAILTSDYHTRRAQLVFAHQGLAVRVIPVPDVAKRLQFVGQRWDAFLTLAGEFGKTAFYRLEHKL